MKSMRSFHTAASLLMGLFFSIMVIALIIVFSRHSGITGMDIAKLHLIRNQSLKVNAP